MERYICIHAHFYQPPRENPWLEAIELQHCAYPYHDWNERIAAECYGPNTSSRILDEKGRIIKFVNNYGKISFNFGPTLLDWLMGNASDVYEAIIGADQESQKTFSGHGSALAQAYNHMILPLANRRDKHTQIIWGIRNFERHFGRKPEGMWLPETAVDLETLDILAEQGILFTILAPYQAVRTRPIGSDKWEDVRGGKIDPSTAYRLHLSSGRTIVLFFFDAPISQAIAFENLLDNGDSFAQRLLGAFWEKRPWPQLVHVATDGETYGHHRRFGEMALTQALQYIESTGLARLTNYGAYLEKHPPSHEVEILENTSWSCAHGVERWRTDCGCSTGTHPGWNQRWRTPLREAFDWFRDTLSPAFEEKGRRFFTDPWKARDDYIDVIHDRSVAGITYFLNRHAIRELEDAEKTIAIKLLEAQRQTMLMYTSCGWFFNEISGIESMQIICYAARALQLTEEIFGDAIKPRFLQLLQRAKSNIAEQGDGRQIYEKVVESATVNLEKVGAHYAISSLFQSCPEKVGTYCYTVDRKGYHCFEAGKRKVLLGRARFTSKITRESAVLSFGVLDLGNHDMHCGIIEDCGEQAYQELVRDMSHVFFKLSLQETRRLLDQFFGDMAYSLKSVFRDERRRIVEVILESMLAETQSMYREVHERHGPLVQFLRDCGEPVPRILCATADIVLNTRLRGVFEAPEFDSQMIESLLEEVQIRGVTLDQVTLEYVLRRRMEQMASQLIKSPAEFGLLQQLQATADLLPSLPFWVDLRSVQNISYQLLQTLYPALQQKANGGDAKAQQWVNCLSQLATSLSLPFE